MEPLFKDQADYDEFTTRHGNNHVKTGDLSTYKGQLLSRNRCRLNHHQKSLS